MRLLNTSIVGARSVTITISSDGQGIAGGVVEIPVAYEVLGGLPCDYSGNGVVDQADLDLVLVNWGADAVVPPDGWVNDPPSGIIDQAELDGVLLNWGTRAPPVGTTAVPEPATMDLLLLTVAVAMGLLRRLRAQPTSIMS